VRLRGYNVSVATKHQSAAPASSDANAPADPTPTGGVGITRTGATWVSLVAGTIVLVLLLVFILENTTSTKVTYFGASGHLPLGVALLLAAVAGALLLGIVGTLRIAQLRHRFGRSRPNRSSHKR